MFLFSSISFVTKQADISFHQVHDVFLFYKSNYKVISNIGGSTVYMWRWTVVIDTGADLNCISKSETPTGSENDVLPSPILQVKGANGISLGNFKYL